MSIGSVQNLLHFVIMGRLWFRILCTIGVFFWTKDFVFAQQMNSKRPGSENDVTDATASTLDSTYFFYERPVHPRDCQEVQDQCSSSNSSGVFLIKPDGYPEPFEVYCVNRLDTGGWTVIHRRYGGAVYFGRTWTDYKLGFGFLSEEFWLGNHKLSHLTNQKNYELRIEMTNSDGMSFFVNYDEFRISDEFSNYNLANIGEYSGNAGIFTTWCKTSGNCTCQKTCENPYSCLNTCSELEICVCPEEYYLKEGRCVPPEECGCYAPLQGTLIPEGDFNANSDCTRLAACTNGQLSFDDSYVCSSNAVCDNRGNVRKCYCNPGYLGDGESLCTISTDCNDIYNAGITDNGVYSIKPTGWPGSAFEVYCNMSDGGGWTVFQRRIDGVVDFYRDWNNYKEGFGSADHEMWLGNEKLYYLTNQKRYTMRVDLVNRDGSPYYAKFNFFRINNENDKYRLSELGTYTGTADGSSDPTGFFLRRHHNDAFSTYDQDNDVASTNCAERLHGAWWYDNCDDSNLNGDYHAVQDSYKGIYCERLPGPDRNIIFSEMKIRPY